MPDGRPGLAPPAAALALDPEVWLHGRLTYGRLGLMLPIAGALVAASIVGVITHSEFLRGLMLPAAYLVMVATPLPVIDRLMQWERDGRLDQHRLTGRRAAWILAAPFVTSMLPTALLATGAIAIDRIAHPGSEFVNDPWMGAILLLVSLCGAMGAFAIAPAAPSPAMAYLASWGLLIATAIVTNVLDIPDWRPVALVVFGVAGAAATYGACWRIDGAGQSGTVTRSSRRRIVWLAWRLPIPPEAGRALAYVLSSRSALVAIFIFPAIALLPAAFDGQTPVWMLSFAPIVGALFVLSAFGKREATGGGDDRVRLTPTPPIQVVLSWIAGAALPFWVASGITAAIVWRHGAWPSEGLVPLSIAAVALPVLGLATGLLQKRGGVYRAMVVTVAEAVVAMVLVLLGEHGDLEWLRQEKLLGSFEMLPILLAALLLLATSGRLETPEGPALGGWLAPWGIVAAITFVLPLPVVLHARLIPVVSILGATFFARGFRGGLGRAASSGVLAAGIASLALLPTTPLPTALRGAALAGVGMALAIAIEERLLDRPASALTLRILLAASLFLAPELAHPSRFLGGSVAGQVTGPDGRPVPGARIEVRRFAREKVVETATADGAGRFEVRRLDTARYRLTATAAVLGAAGSNIRAELGHVVTCDLRLRRKSGPTSASSR